MCALILIFVRFYPSMFRLVPGSNQIATVPSPETPEHNIEAAVQSHTEVSRSVGPPKLAKLPLTNPAPGPPHSDLPTVQANCTRPLMDAESGVSAEVTTAANQDLCNKHVKESDSTNHSSVNQGNPPEEPADAGPHSSR